MKKKFGVAIQGVYQKEENSEEEEDWGTNCILGT
jgi:hypothetical protein